jgi:hypothetical protein
MFLARRIALLSSFCIQNRDLAPMDMSATAQRQFPGQAPVLFLYRELLEHPCCQAYLALLKVLEQPDVSEALILQSYSRWFHTVAATGLGWQAWLEEQILRADNPFTQQVQFQPLSALSPGLVQAAAYDLNVLQGWAVEVPHWIQSALAKMAITGLPSITSLSEDLTGSSCFHPGSTWAEALSTLAKRYQERGVGVFATAQAFQWRNGGLVTIPYPEMIQLADLVGYEDQKAALQQNTEALLAGHVALNVLLYGSRGSGKSALIKALLTEYAQKGLRLIELNKADMLHLPQVVERLRASVLKFVIFIDDLSFEENEDQYKALKVLLEGTLTTRPQNVVVYATSNRRHLIREFFGDRPRPSQADEVHSWDTVEEKLSLSDRFGLTLTFEPANQTTYLQIVHHLARHYGIAVSDALTHQALQWAVRHNVRSGRTARQFIDYIQGQSSPPLRRE